jgi:hypothetical protein
MKHNQPFLVEPIGNVEDRLYNFRQSRKRPAEQKNEHAKENNSNNRSHSTPAKKKWGMYVLAYIPQDRLLSAAKSGFDIRLNTLLPEHERLFEPHNEESADNTYSESKQHRASLNKRAPSMAPREPLTP